MKELLDKPYPLRQFLIVERDEIIEAKRKAEREAIEKLSDEDSAQKNSITKIISSTLANSFSTSLSGTLGGMLVEVIMKSVEKQKELSRKINVNYLSYTETQTLKFPIGHPRENELYVGHPTLSGVYYPINEFHKKVFEHKFAELNFLLMNLGAKKVEVEYISGWDFEAMSQVDVPSKGRGKLGEKTLNSKRTIYKANYEDNDSLKLPDELAWYHFEPTWQSVGEGRLNHNLHNFNLLLEYNNDFGINADLYATVSNIGFGTKNKFNKKESTTWKVVGEF
ncbi:hypothetical protein IZY60_01895 [Lutibacter sp. B2]|nr:hypothetical protein [Lutibacter sp. B2]